MIRINLLPHREHKRRERRKQFYVGSALMILLGLAIGYLGHTYMAQNIERQEGRNNYFKAEIKKLDEEIAEIRNLRSQIEALLARKQVIESLQGNRAETVHMFNELARRMPEGVHLNTIKQTGSRVLLTGYAQSNARVSHLMRSLEESPYLAQPGLIEARATTANNRRLSQFSLNISLVRPAADESKGKGEAQ